MKILSRNVNGIRSIVQKWFVDTIQRINPDVIALQETKAFEHQIPDTIKDLGYHIYRHQGERPGYAGTALLSKLPAQQFVHTFPHPEFGREGRITEIQIGNLTIINGYFPNGWTRADGTEMLGYKLQFYEDMMTYLRGKSDTPICLVGDYNICHTERDIARPKENIHSIGFLPVERTMLSTLFQNGMTDVFRHLYPDAVDQYTWRSYRAWAKNNNVGRRIDYACVSDILLEKIIDFQHFPEIWGSDHCPLMITLDI